jgi:hypothetical protein
VWARRIFVAKGNRHFYFFVKDANNQLAGEGTAI